MLPLQYTIPSEKNLEKCIITKEFIDKEKEIDLIYSKEPTDEITKEINYKKIVN